MKFLQLTVMLFSIVLLAGCVEEETSSSSGSSGSSSSGSVLNYGGYDYSYSCPYSGSATAPIPPTSSSYCETIYERYASELSCNNIDNYDSLVNEYYSCYQQDIAACQSASLSDPNCY